MLHTPYEREVYDAEKKAAERKRANNVFNAQTEILRWLSSLGHQVDFSNVPAVLIGVRVRRRRHSNEFFSSGEMLRKAVGTPCPYCLIAMPRTGKYRASRDHLVPRIKGGTLSPENVLIVCQSCNSDKSHLSLIEWAAMLRRKKDPRAETVSLLIKGRLAELAEGSQKCARVAG